MTVLSMSASLLFMFIFRIGFSFYWEVFNNNLVGYGSAIAMILLILLIPFMVFQVRRIKAQESYR